MQIRRLFSGLPTISGLDPRPTRLSRARLLGLCTVIFLTSLGVRLLYWQDNYPVLFGVRTNGLQMMAPAYRDHAQRMLEDGGFLSTRTPEDPGDATTLVHPPGYPMLLVAVLRLFRQENSKHELAQVDAEVRIVQVVCDAFSSAVIFLIAAELFPVAIGIIAAMLASLSPHFGYYSLMLAPDSLSVLPILLAVFFLIRASKRPRLATVIAAGAFVGLSCWLRSNALLLAPFLLLCVPLLFGRGRRLRYSLAFMCGTVLVLAPIIIRNWIVFDRFVPLSATAGRLLLEGIGNYDKENSFGSPSDEDEAALKEAQLYGRPDYALSLWKPDGIERDQARLKQGLAVARAKPGWFLGVMVQRMALMLRYNDARQQLANVSIAPTLSAVPNFGHTPEPAAQAVPELSCSPRELMAAGKMAPGLAQAAILDDNRTLQITADGTGQGELFSYQPINVKKNTDYVIRLYERLKEGSVDVKIGPADPRIVLALVAASSAERPPKRTRRDEDADQPDLDLEPRMRVLLVPFASGNNTQVRLSFYKSTEERAVLNVGQAEMFEMGQTAYLWTRYPRAIIRAVQRNIFKTDIMRALIALGIVLLALARRWRVLGVVMIVPVYYLLAQSPLHTEYRYVLAIHYFLFVIAGVTIYYASLIMGQGARRGYRFARAKVTMKSS